MDKIEELEKRIKQLEDKLNKTQQSFGRSYTSVGSLESDYLIKTKGQIKIQYGSKFIDLIKDGKINVESRFIYKQEEVGTKDGIYVNSNGEVILKIRDLQIQLTNDTGTTYVSFMNNQSTTPQEKQTALKNIGFIYETLEELDESIVQNGIIYVTSENKIYTIVNGRVQQYGLKIPNPYTEQFVIQKNDNKEGALVIRGSGVNNSLKFDTLTIYSDTQSYINSQDALHFIINNKEIFYIDQNIIKSASPLQINELYSNGQTVNNGFWLYTDSNNKSYLYVDNLTVRNQLYSNISQNIYPDYYWYSNNIADDLIESAYKDESGNPVVTFTLVLRYLAEYYEGQILVTFLNINDVLTEIQLTVQSVDGKNVTVVSNTEIDYKELIGKVIFVKNGLKLSKEGLGFYIGQDLDSVIGDLSQVPKAEKDNEDIIPLTGNGLYSNRGYFKYVAYTSDYTLEENDNSSKLASTEWVNKKSLPSGTIVMYSGNTIPDGWALCDGTNGTPNLVEHFIIGGTQQGFNGSYNIETSESGSLTINWIYMVFIMKI